MTTGLCTTCGDPVVVAQNGRVLTRQAVELGTFDPTDGEPLTRRQVVDLVRDTGLAGHAPHACDVGAVCVETPATVGRSGSASNGGTPLTSSGQSTRTGSLDHLMRRWPVTSMLPRSGTTAQTPRHDGREAI